MNREDKIESLYLYTCEGIPVTSRNSSKEVITDYIDVNSNEIYAWLRQSVNTSHRDGNAYQSGENCGCFMSGRYRNKVKRWMIEEYVDSNTNENLISYIDDLLHDSVKKSNREIKTGRVDRAYTKNHEESDSYGSILEAMKHPRWWASIVLQLIVLIIIVRVIVAIVT